VSLAVPGGPGVQAAPPRVQDVWYQAAVGVVIVAIPVALLVLAARRGGSTSAVFLVIGVAALVLLELGLTLASVTVGRDVRLWRAGNPQLRVLIGLAHLGRWLTRADRERLLHSFIQTNNLLVRATLGGRAREVAPAAPRILALAPTCLQAGDCTREIAKDASLCERCGKCPVRDLVELAEQRDIELHFVAGGTLARSLVETRAPDAIVAVACERELTEGILFSRKVPVMAVPNTRPKGPCKETQVDIADVREAVDALGA
jgi:hypothetical protein